MRKSWESAELLLAYGFSRDDFKIESILPVKWLLVGEPLRQQGWKLHISSRSDYLPDLVSAMAPILLETAATFKVAASSHIAEALNSGEGGRFQIGKIVTIYPKDDAAAVRIGAALTERLRGFPGPVIENELRLKNDAPVYARYGGFIPRRQKTKLGTYMDFIENKDGEAVPDLRSFPMYKVLDFSNPFPDAVEFNIEKILGERLLRIGPLAETRRSILEVGVDLETSKPCVLKRVKRHSAIDGSNRDAVQRLKVEEKMLQFLKDTDAVPRRYTLWEDKDWAVLSMELIEGNNLFQYAKARQQDSSITQGDLAKLVNNITNIIIKIHKENVVIGDLSPTNIMVEPSGKIKLIDLEFARKRGNKQSNKHGTFGYTAPWVLTGEVARFQDDLYSLGAIIYYLVTGTDVSSIPNAHSLLVEGDSLPEPWKSIVINLVEKGQEPTSELLKKTLYGCNLIKDDMSFPKVVMVDTKLNQESKSYLPTLEKVGNSILSFGQWSIGVSPVWLSRHPYTNGEKYRDFNMGDAGIAFGMLRIGLATERIDFIEASVNVAERLWTKSDDIFLPGLFVGEAGIGWLYLTLYELLGDSIWLERAAHVSHLVAEMEYDSPDLFHGTAGRGLFHTWVYKYTNDPEDLTAAVSAAYHLQCTYEMTSEGPLWNIPNEYGELEEHAYYGIAHGNAGIAYFLAELSNFATFSWVENLMHKIGESLKNVAERDSKTGLPSWRDRPNGVFRNGVWCHGSTGIALMYIRMYQASNEDKYLQLAIQAAENALQQGHRIGPTQCHGIAGLLEVYLDLYEVTKNPEYLMISRRLGERLEKVFVVKTGEDLMICAEFPDVLTSEFMVGASGAAAALARLEQPDRFGHFLQSPNLAFRIQSTV